MPKLVLTNRELDALRNCFLERPISVQYNTERIDFFCQYRTTFSDNRNANIDHGCRRIHRNAYRQAVAGAGDEVVGIDNVNDYYDVRLKQRALDSLRLIRISDS